MIEFSTDTNLPLIIPRLNLSDGEHAYLAGGRAVERHVGRTVMSAVREAHGVRPTCDIDLAVSTKDYKLLRKHPRMQVKEIRHTSLRGEPAKPHLARSLWLADPEGLDFDIWRERWFEPDREGDGTVPAHELAQHSVFDPELAINILSREYLTDQRIRTIDYYTSRSMLSTEEQVRLAKDKADIAVLSA